MNAVGRLRWWWLGRTRQAAARSCPALAEMLLEPLPSPRQPVRNAPLLAVDLEMTGLDPRRDAIVSIGWVPISDGGVQVGGGDEVAVAADPARGVGHSATIHGIRDCDRSGGLPPAEALACLATALEGRVAVFHHAPLDLGFLDRAFREAFGTRWLWPWIDTLDWHRRRQHGRHDDEAAAPTRLDAVREYYGLTARTAHNALDDAVSCAEVAMILGAHSRARLIDVCSLPVGR